MTSDELNTRIAELWATGISASEIAAKFGITKNVVIGRVKRMRNSGRGNIVSLERPHTPLSIAAQKRADQRSLYILQRRDFDKATFYAIANELGLSYDTVQREYADIMRGLNRSEAE